MDALQGGEAVEEGSAPRSKLAEWLASKGVRVAKEEV